jgi:hypothetical protein
MSGTVSKHVALVGELSKEVKENSLLDVSECEQVKKEVISEFLKKTCFDKDLIQNS